MKKLITIILVILLTVTVAAAEDTLSFQSLTGLDEMQQKLDAGISIDRVYYTDGYGFSTSEFITTDQEEIQALWAALNQITIKGQVNESITDWYPQIIFYLSDGTTAHATFESHWLSLPNPWPQANYELENDDAFWSLTSALVNKYESSVHPKENTWTGSWDGRYCIGVKDVAEDHIDLALYREDLYDRGEIESLMPGDTVIVDGKTYTVAVLVIRGYFDSDGDGEADSLCAVKDKDKYQEVLDRHEMVIDCDYSEVPATFEISHFELISEEEFDGYIVFEILSDGQECRAVVNDWNPCTYVGKTTIQLPLPENFVFEDYTGNENGAESFLEQVDSAWYTPYNTDAWFENGLLVKVSHSDYPTGPESY